MTKTPLCSDPKEGEREVHKLLTSAEVYASPKREKRNKLEETIGMLSQLEIGE